MFENVSLVVVAESPRDLIVGHLRAVAVFPPECGKGLRVVEAKQPLFTFLPRDHVLVFWLLQDTEGEFPELRAGRDVWREEGENMVKLDCLKTVVSDTNMCIIIIRSVHVSRKIGLCSL